MTPQELKSSILQFAIQGKLVEQRDEEGTAEDLYKQIQEEKERLIKEKKIKNQKALPEITEDEIPFDIPDSWKWVHCQDIIYLNSGGQYKETFEGALYIKVADMNLPQNENEIATSSHYVSKTNIGIIPVNSIIFPKRGGAISTNKKRLIKQMPVFIDSNTMGMTVINENTLSYIKMWFDSIDLGQLQTGTSVPQINNKDIYPLLIPLPPLEEQKRIVAKIEELLPLIDKYEKAWTKLEEFNKKFPDDMQKSILQMAIQGKLVEQRAEEGTADEIYKQIQEEKQKLIKEGKIKKQKALPEITEDEIPFDIPESWKWIRLGDCSSYSQSKPKIKAKDITAEMWSLDLEDIEKETGRIINICKASERKITGEKVCFYKDQILYSKLRPYLKKIIVAPNDGICTPELVPFRMYSNIDNRYITYVLKSPHVDYVINAVTYGVKMPRVGTETMVNLLIPLPPVEEQKRIINEVERLFSVCKDIKATINTTH